MPKPIPFATKLKNVPDVNQETPSVPVAEIKETPQPEATPKPNNIPAESQQPGLPPKEAPVKTEIPEESPKVEGTPDPAKLKEELPPEVDPENCIKVEGQMIEIKPTKLKYFRNNAANSYGWLTAVPLDEFMNLGKGVLDKNRDSDQILLDFLVAVFDDVQFVRKHYDEFTAADVDRIVKIFGRINGIEEKREAARKNREAQANR